MKTSDIFKTNRLAENNKISLEQYENFHIQFAKEYVENKLEEDKKIHQFLNDELKDFHEKVYFESVAEQKGYYFNQQNQIQESFDKQTYINLEQYKKDVQVKSDALSKHIENQRSALAKAVQEKARLKKNFEVKYNELKKLQQQLIKVEDKKSLILNEIEEKNKNVNHLNDQQIVAKDKINTIFNHRDNFDIKHQDSLVHPAQYALDRDKAFADKLTNMVEQSQNQQNVMVRERIELEMERQKAAYSIMQNEKIQQLTQESRSEKIEEQQKLQNTINQRIAEVEIELEKQNIKVDFNESEVEVREIRHEERIADQLKQQLDTINKAKKENKNLVDLNNELMINSSEEKQIKKDVNDSLKSTIEARSNYENKLDNVNQIKLNMVERLKQQRELSRQHNNLYALENMPAKTQELQLQARKQQEQRLIEQQQTSKREDQHVARTM